MSYQSLIDDALVRARTRTGSSLPATSKLASIAGGSLLDDAEKVANALEYLSLSIADDGGAVGAARVEMVRDFFKSATEGSKASPGPMTTETTTPGTQTIAPAAGKAKLNPVGLVSGNAPKQTTAPEGAMSRTVLEQTPAANPTKSASLYDLLMTSRMAKIAEDAKAPAPRQMDAEMAPPAHSHAQEGGHAQGPLASAASLIAAKRSQLRDPTRARLSEIFAHVSDTGPSLASAQAAFPMAAAMGGMKTASVAQLAVLLQKEAAETEQPGYLDRQRAVQAAMRNSDKGVGQFLASDELVGKRYKKALVPGLAGAGVGALGGLAFGSDPHLSPLIGALMGGTIGQAVGMTRGDKEYLAARGIKQKYFGLDHELSPEAIERYHHMKGEKKASVADLAVYFQKEASPTPGTGPGMLSSANMTGARDAAKGGIDSAVGYLHTPEGWRNAKMLGGAGAVAAGTLYARKKLKDMREGGRNRAMQELSKGASVSDLAVYLQKQATGVAAAAGAEGLSSANLHGVGDAAKGGIDSAVNYLHTPEGWRNAKMLGGAAAVAGGTLLARKKLKDMREGSKNRQMRELGGGY